MVRIAADLQIALCAIRLSFAGTAIHKVCHPYLKSMLCEVAWIMASHRKLYLSGWYWKVKQRKGAKRATIALARKILSIIYTMLKTGTPYNEECFEQRRLRCERKRANRLVNELQKLGYVVVAPD